MSESLEQVLADEREQANVLRRKGFVREADIADGILDRVRAAAEDYLTWLNPRDAALASGLADLTLRRRFRELYDAGNARYTPKGDMEYRKSALPRRPQLAAARDAAQRRIARPA